MTEIFWIYIYILKLRIGSSSGMLFLFLLIAIADASFCNICDALPGCHKCEVFTLSCPPCNGVSYTCRTLIFCFCHLIYKCFFYFSYFIYFLTAPRTTTWSVRSSWTPWASWTSWTSRGLSMYNYSTSGLQYRRLWLPIMDGPRK